MYKRTLTNVNNVPYSVALSADRSVAKVRRVEPDRGVIETWELNGQADFVHMLRHYKVNNPDEIARDYWRE